MRPGNGARAPRSVLPVQLRRLGGGGTPEPHKGCLEDGRGLEMVPVQEALLFYQEIIVCTMETLSEFVIT